MSPLPRFARQLIRITEPGTRLVYGSPVKDWTVPGSTRTARGWAVPAQTDEFNINRDAVRTGWNVYLEPDTALTADSKLTLPDGKDYHVIGDPAPVPAPRTGPGRGLDHIFVYVERWEG